MHWYGLFIRYISVRHMLILAAVLSCLACAHQQPQKAETPVPYSASQDLDEVQRTPILPSVLNTSSERSELVAKGAVHLGYMVFESDAPFNGVIPQDVLEEASALDAESVFVVKKDIIITAESEHELCDFSKEQDQLKEIILKQRACRHSKSQTYYRDYYRHYLELWSQSGDKVVKHLNQRLMWIAENNNTQDLEPLLNSGAQVEVIAEWLVSQSQDDLKQVLMEYLPDDLLFQWAIESDREEIIDAMLASNYQAPSNAVTTALVRNNTQFAKKLLDSGTPFPVLDFLQASCFGESHIVLNYLQLGGDPNVLVNESTPLLCARQFEQKTITRLFNDKGYQLNTQVHPYDLLVLQFDDRLVTYAWYGESFCARVYQSFYVREKAVSKDNATGLLYCATKDNVTSLALQALKFEGDVSFSPFQSDPIHFASYYGNIQLIDGLLKKGANSNSLDGIRNTPLHNAAISGELKAVQMLCAAGADPWLKNNSGHTALELARTLRNRELEIWLTMYQRQFLNNKKTSSTNFGQL